MNCTQLECRAVQQSNFLRTLRHSHSRRYGAGRARHSTRRARGVGDVDDARARRAAAAAARRAAATQHDATQRAASARGRARRAAWRCSVGQWPDHRIHEYSVHSVFQFSEIHSESVTRFLHAISHGIPIRPVSGSPRRKSWLQSRTSCSKTRINSHTIVLELIPEFT